MPQERASPGARRRVARLALVAALASAPAVLAGCRSTDDARVLQVLNQRGFGRPTQDANRQYYVGIGDSIVIDDTIHTEYRGQQESVRMDGVITLRDVGEVYVNGLSPEEVSEVVRLAYSRIVNSTDGISARVVGTQSKKYYVSGLPPYPARTFTFSGDLLLNDAVIRSGYNATLVDSSRILVIRADPENPLVIECDFDAIMQEGLSRDNIQIRENDIIYLTPSIVGWITAGVAKLVAPLTPIQQLIFGYNNIISVTDSFGQGTIGYGGGHFNQHPGF